MGFMQILGLFWIPLISCSSWYCGTDIFTGILSFTAVTVADKYAIDSVNMCCYLHDGCYESKQGREYCDEAFCRCLHDYFQRPSHGAIAARNTTATKKFVEEVCDLVRHFGEGPYNDKGSWFSLKALAKWMSSKLRLKKNSY
uniref:Phospholipase A2 n=1 Tax=Syphacia muris TaxID=451379 RepID=A0A158R5W6_9BILA